MKSYDVKFWEIRPGKAKKKRTWEVRWKVGTRPRSKSYGNKEQAKNFLSELRQAARNGEPFDVETGLPDSMAESAEARSWFAFAQAYALAYWPDAAANTRDSLTDALATVTPALVADNADTPPDVPVMRRALRTVAFVPEDRRAESTPDMAAALRWLERHSLPMPELVKPDVAQKGLSALGRKMDGQRAATTTYRRKRAVFFNALQYAMDHEEISDNPLTRIRAKRRKGRKQSIKQVDRRTLVNPRQAEELLTALTYVGRSPKHDPVVRSRGARMRGLFACIYYGALRPEETAGLRKDDCTLPEKGWGSLILAKTLPEAGKRWTDSGDVHDARGLKHRDDGETRTVPIPPNLVRILRAHIDTYDVTEDGRLFRTRTGRPFTYSAIYRVLQDARRLAFPPDKQTSMLADIPYALRHAAISTWLNAGISPSEVAERAGNSEEMVLSVYAGCLDGDRERMNKRIEAALNADYG